MFNERYFYLMAQFSHLPLYIKTYDFVKLIYQISHQFPKEYKYGLGAEMQKIAWDILDEIVRVNSLPDLEKRQGINRISALFDRFKIRFRLAYELGFLPAKKFAFAQSEIQEIGRMIGGWIKWAG